MDRSDQARLIEDILSADPYSMVDEQGFGDETPLAVDAINSIRQRVSIIANEAASGELLRDRLVEALVEIKSVFEDLQKSQPNTRTDAKEALRRLRMGHDLLLSARGTRTPRVILSNNHAARPSEADALTGALSRLERLEDRVSALSPGRVEEDVRRVTAAAARAEKVMGDLEARVGKAHLLAYAKVFQKEAEKHALAALLWLAAACILAGVTVWTAVSVLEDLSTRLDRGTGELTWNYTITKAIIFSILLTALLWVGQSYRSSQHNSIVNRHRCNAIVSFEAFYGTAVDPTVKDAVLLQATHCIFSAQPTGFVPGASDTQSPARLPAIVSPPTGPRNGV